MLRSFFVSLSKALWAQKLITSWGFARRAAFRFVAGETLSEAVQVVEQLNAHGIRATLDQLGENTLNKEDALSATIDIVDALTEIERTKIPANVSIKLSQIGMGLEALLFSFSDGG